MKQCGWTKTRHVDGTVTWTGRTGRAWLSAAQHPHPEPAMRALPPLVNDDPLAELSPGALEAHLRDLGLLPEDDFADHRQPDDVAEPDSDRLGYRLAHGDTRWTLDLDDPYSRLPAAGRPA